MSNQTIALPRGRLRLNPVVCALVVVATTVAWPGLLLRPSAVGRAEEKTASRWKYDSKWLRPFWEGDSVEGESVLFIRDPQTGIARGLLLFPVVKGLDVRNSAGDAAYEEGRDFTWQAGSREIVLPAGSRIVSALPAELRRPAGSQKYRLTHRDGDGEILFGAGHEYQDLQTAISYSHVPDSWKGPVPKFAGKALPRSSGKLREGQPLSIVLLGDSISTGCNASGWAETAPYQPPYQDLLREHLQATCRSPVTLENLAVGGTDTAWGLTRIEQVVAPRPDLVLLAFGMNDSARRPADEYRANIESMVRRVRETLPECEFILVASMLGNRDWTALQHELFPQYRDALGQLCGPGIALADLTSIWDEFFKFKRDWDLSGNGVNHPNDFGHRVYAQVLSTLLVPPRAP